MLLTQLRHDYLRGRAPSQRLPSTIGQNVLDVPYRRTILHLWDLGGSAAMRSLWDQYLPDAHVIVWVIDAPRWASDTAVADELGRSYRAAVFESLCPVIAEASARAQPVCVVVTQLDELASDRAASLVREVETSVTAEWTRRLDDTSLDGTLSPIWSFQGVSAATGYVSHPYAATVSRRCWTSCFVRPRPSPPRPAPSPSFIIPPFYSTKGKLLVHDRVVFAHKQLHAPEAEREGDSEHAPVALVVLVEHCVSG